MELLSHFRNLQTVTLCNQQITQIRGLRTLRTLERLWLNNNCIAEIQGLEECTGLKCLYLTGNKITKIKGLDTLSKLKVLWLAENEISTLGGLKQLRRLRELNVASNKIAAIGNLLEPLKELAELNISNNLIGNLKEMLGLKRLPKLRTVSFSDPHYGENPMCGLSNYQIYVLYHLPRVELLDASKVSEESKVMAEVTFMKKRMFYNMKIKTIKRIAFNVMKMIKSCERIRRSAVNKEIDYLALRLKDCTKELEEHNYQIHPIDNERAEQLGRKKEFIEQKIAAKCKAVQELEQECEAAKKRCYEVAENNVYRLMTELETGGNVRFEEGKSSDKWFKSCAELLQARFNASHVAELGECKLNVTRITKVHNKYLRNLFEERLEQTIDICNKNIKKNLDYLFCGSAAYTSAELTKIIEEGARGNVAMPIGLVNSVTLAELPRLHKLVKDNVACSQLPPGFLVIWKSYMPTQAMDKGCPEFDPTQPLAEVLKSHPPEKTNTDCCYRASIRDPNQKLWIFYDPTIIIPEYIAEFEYVPEVKPQGGTDKMLNGLVGELLSVQNAIKESYKQMMGKVAPDGSQSGSVNSADLDKADLSCLKLLLIKLINKCPLEKLLKNEMKYEVSQALIGEVEALPPEDKKHSKEELKIALPLKDKANLLYLNLHHTGIGAMENLSLPPSLRVLVLSHNSIKKIEGLEDNLLLERLELGYNQIAKIENMETLENLKVFEMNNNYVQSINDLKHLKLHNTGLEELTVRNNPFTSNKNYKAKVLNFLPELKKLDNKPVLPEDLTINREEEKVTEEVMLANAKFSSNPMQTDAQSPSSKEELIEELTLAHMKLTVIGLNALRSLKKLNLSNNKITKIEGLDNCVLLEELNLEHNKISVIENVGHLSQLKILDIGRNKIQAIAGLEGLENLLQLSLENNFIHSLENLPPFKDLMELYIGNNLISDFGQLKILRRLEKLIILDINGNKVGEDGRSRHYMLFHLKKLKVLDGASIERTEFNEACSAYDGKLTEEVLLPRLAGKLPKNVVELDLSSAKLKDSSNVFNEAMFPELQSLNLSNNLFSSLRPLGSLPKLKKLLASQNRIESFHCKSGAGLLGIPVAFAVT